MGNKVYVGETWEVPFFDSIIKLTVAGSPVRSNDGWKLLVFTEGIDMSFMVDYSLFQHEDAKKV